MKALVISKKKEIGDALVKLIRPLRFDRIDQTNSAQEAKRRVGRTDYDLIIINTPLTHQFGSDLALDLTRSDGPDLVILVRNDALAGVERKLEEAPVYIVPKPINKPSIMRDLRYILNNRERRLDLIKQNTKLKRKLEGQKLQFRAKLVLMEKLNLSEEEAHRYLQKRAMDEQRRPEDVSKAIINYYGSK